MKNNPRKIFTIEAIMNLLKDRTGVEDVFPSTFPTKAQDTCIIVVFAGGQRGQSTIKYPSLQVIVRSKQPDIAYALTAEVTEYLSRLHDMRLESGELLITCNEQHPYPLFIGQDENRRHMYSINFTMVVEQAPYNK